MAVLSAGKKCCQAAGFKAVERLRLLLAGMLV